MAFAGAFAVAPAPALGAASEALQLDVSLDGHSVGLVGSFFQDADGELSATGDELRDIGVAVPPSQQGGNLVQLRSVPGLRYRYDLPKQSIDILLPDGGRIVRTLNASPPLREAALRGTQTETGAILNYDLIASGGQAAGRPLGVFQGAAATLDGRMFSRQGVLYQSGIVRLGSAARDFTRLDTRLVHDDRDRSISYGVGDAISSGPAWARPIRMAGLSINREFALRPDLITVAMPSLSGTAAVPTTIDVLVDNVKSFSGEVNGPYRVANLPALAGSGDASVVVRDSLGHETVQSLAFYTTPRVLADGVLDFAFDAGIPRYGYGTSSNSYRWMPFVNSSARFGLTDGLTGETHVEAARGLFNGSVGAAGRLGGLGAAEVAVGGSSQGSRRGVLAYAALEGRWRSLSMFGSLQRTWGDYSDLASFGRRFDPVRSGASAASLFSSSSPRALDRVAVGVPLRERWGSLSLGYAHIRQTSEANHIVTLSYGREVWRNGSFYATAFADVTGRNQGALVGLSLPFDDGLAIAVGSSMSGGSVGRTLDISKPLGPETGAFGGRLYAVQGKSDSQFGQAGYRTAMGRIGAQVERANGVARGTLVAEGAIAGVGSDFGFANRIDDAFAIVDAGYPGVSILVDNKPAGRTSASGKLVLPALRSNDANKVTLDPVDLPLDAKPDAVSATVTPARGSGARVEFGLRPGLHGLRVQFFDGAGQALPVGTTGVTRSEQFVVGYDGESYLADTPDGDLTLILPNGRACKVSVEDLAKRETARASVALVCREASP